MNKDIQWILVIGAIFAGAMYFTYLIIQIGMLDYVAYAQALASAFTLDVLLLAFFIFTIVDYLKHKPPQTIAAKPAKKIFVVGPQQKVIQ